MTLALSGFSGLFGLLIGSFLNVVIYRVPAGMSVVRPASACPGCGSEIRARDNVPVLSWILLRGRCRACRTAISARYPAIELATALAFVAVALGAIPSIVHATASGQRIGAVIELVALLYLAAISVALTMIDLDVRRLPDSIVLPSYVVTSALLAGAALVSGDPQRLIQVAIGGAASYVFYFVLALVYPAGMQFGDIKLAGVLGIVLAWFGWDALIVGTMAAFLLGGVFGLVLMAIRRAGRKTAIPFGPWMLVGAWIGIAAGAPLSRLYLSLVGLA